MKRFRDEFIDHKTETKATMVASLKDQEMDDTVNVTSHLDCIASFAAALNLQRIDRGAKAQSVIRNVLANASITHSVIVLTLTLRPTCKKNLIAYLH